ncbi:amidohydrolase family protein [Mesorhizobium retamae]|uniref:Amidohydrolase family protein n=1 Tax=Mesorhizobium retamae TaxID=2912854 RepID=A0ABS9QD97_9HYPH|nr:amidohydrolase family protein [Mesorhizobium sp. IRAMC:0171]MCG7505397.1 amidohydrolase family protein [Mesorhizobium sp. IRAMC:0171]
MLVDFASRPPLPEFSKTGAHLSNYRRVYEKSEKLTVGSDAGQALDNYLAMYERIGTKVVVLKARDLESTFGFAITNKDVAAFCRAHGPRFIGFAGVDPYKTDAVSELDFAINELGLRGLNIQCFEHLMNADDRRLYPLYEKCIELDIPVNIHCGVNFARPAPMTHGRPESIDRVLVDFPTLRVCASPPGWPWVNELIAVAMRHPTLFIGLVAVRPKLLATDGSGYEPLLQYGRTLLADRMIFGSSFPLVPVGRSIEEIRALPIPGDVQEKWLGANAAVFLKL